MTSLVQGSGDALVSNTGGTRIAQEPATPRLQGHVSYGVVILTKLLLLLVILDPSGDPMLTLDPGIKAAGQVIRSAIIPALILLMTFSLCVLSTPIRVNVTARTALALTLVVLAGGLINGLVANVSWNVWREFAATLPLLCIPAFLRFTKEQKVRFATYVATALVVICTAKVLMGQYCHWQVYNTLSYKVLLRQSPLLLFPYSLFLASYLRGVRSPWKTLLFILAVVGMLVAQARALHVAAAIVTFIVLWKYSTPGKTMGFVVFLGIAALVMTWVSDNRMAEALGRWSGDSYQSTVEYRLEQTAVLIDRMREKPILGFGFGYYTPGYESYEDLAIPQILELDLFNFATKVGGLFFAVYVLSYWLYGIAHARLTFVDKRTELIAMSYVMLIVGLLVYSLFQTFHASLMFWLFYALAFSFVFGGDVNRPRSRKVAGCLMHV